MIEELKPCPFCPSDDRSVLLIGGLLNPQCNACKSSCGLFNTEGEAIAAWNHRQPDTGLVEALEKILEDAIDGDENGMCMYYSIKLEVNDLLAKYRSKE